MKEIEFSPKVYKKLHELKRKDHKTFLKIKKQLVLFQKDPHHSSLRLHKLKGNLKNVWSISIDRNYRMVYTENKTIYFFNLGTHDEVYEK